MKKSRFDELPKEMKEQIINRLIIKYSKNKQNEFYN